MTSPIPINASITTASVIYETLVLIQFDDDTEGVINLQPLMVGPLFDDIFASNSFGEFFVEGGTITWANGADLAPDVLWAEVQANTLPFADNPTS